MQDFPTLLERYGLEIAGYFDVSRPAVLDERHHVRLGYEAFFFADRAGRDRFIARPLAYCGLLTDPVSKRRFRPTGSSPSARHDGVTFYFETRANRDRFEAMPESYQLPGYVMEPGGRSAEGGPPAGEPDPGTSAERRD